MTTHDMAPFDLIDFCWLSAGAAYHPLLPLTIGQWFVRRSKKACQACQWITHTSQQLLTAHHPILATLATPMPTGDDILARLEQAVHLLLIGETGGGKTSLLHSLALRLHDSGARVVVCDPDSIAGDYGYRCVGAGDDYEAIGKAFALLSGEMSKHREQRKLGTRTFAPIWFFVDEVHDVIPEITGAWDTLTAAIRRGRKLNIHIVLGTQDSQVKNLKLEGKSQLLTNLTRVKLEIREGKRWAILEKDEYIIPHLPSPDDMVKPVSSHPKTTETGPLLAQLLEAVSGSLKPKTTETTETSKPFFETALNQAIRERLATGESKNKVAAWLGDEHGIRNKVTALKMINEAIGGDQ